MTNEEKFAQINVGDSVVTEWETKGGSFRRFRARVIGKTAKRVRVEYVKTSANSRGFSMEAVQTWKPWEQVRKVKPTSGEKTASESIGDVVRALAGKEAQP